MERALGREAVTEPSQEHAADVNVMRRDTAPMGVKVFRWLKQPQSVAMSLAVMAAGAYAMPGLSDLTLAGSARSHVVAMRRVEDMPIKTPIYARSPDPKEAVLGQKPPMGKGIFFFGNRIKDGKQLWLTNDDCRQHFLVLGTTGSGKDRELAWICH